MSTQGVGPAGLPPWLRGPVGPARDTPRQTGGAGDVRTGGATPRPSPPAADAALSPASLASPPDGVDPELWSLLTTEERAHFGRFADMGGVTYGPGASRPSRPAVQGRRLDLKI